MSHHRFRQLGIAVALPAALGLAVAPPSAAQAARRAGTRLVQPQPGLFELAWDWLAGAIPGARSLSRLWAADTGPGIDSNGARTTGTPPVRPATDAGPGLDPDGRH